MFSFIPAIFSPSSASSRANGRNKSSGVHVRTPEQCMADYIMDRDKKAFDLLYKSCADDLYHYLVTLSDPTIAKDIAQQTWVKVMEKPQGYHTQGSVKAWLFKVSRNALIDEFRKTNRLQEFDSELEEKLSAQDLHLNNLLNADLESAFDHALSCLPFPQKEAFCLQQEGFSLADIALMTGSKQETIKTRLRYARNNLKQLLENLHE